MAIMTYTQERGFQEVPEPVAWPDDADEESWLRDMGFHTVPETCDGGEDTFGYSLRVFTRTKEARIEWEYLVSVWDAAIGDYILVRNRADLLALRIAMAPMMMLEAHSALDELKDLARKAFQAWHGHSGSQFCEHCDPERMKMRKARALKARPPEAPKTPASKPSQPKSTKPN